MSEDDEGLLGVVGERAQAGVRGGEELELVVGECASGPGRLSRRADTVGIELPAIEVGAVLIDPFARPDAGAQAALDDAFCGCDHRIAMAVEHAVEPAA